MTTHEGTGGSDTSPLDLLRHLDRLELLATATVLSALAAATLLTTGLTRLLGLT
jgi:hypothetical protein